MTYLHTISFVLLAQAYLTKADTSCCMPNRSEVERFFVEDNVKKTFVADYSVQRVFETDDLNSNAFAIWDLKKEKVYTFDNKGCRYRHSQKVKQFARCINDETDTDDHQFVIIGGEHFYPYRTQIGDVKFYRLVRGPRDECRPFLSHATNGVRTKTVLYSNWNNTIRDTRLYRSFYGCEEDTNSPLD